MQMECSFQHLSVQIFLALEMKLFACKMGLFQKVTTHKLCQNANFENRGTTIQVCILQVLLNIFSLSSLPRMHDTSVNFKIQEELSCHFTF